MSKTRVAVVYGGRSGEHEVSLVSAASVLRNLDRSRFDIVPIAIDKEGRWHLNELGAITADAKSLPVVADAPVVVLPPFPANGSCELIPAKVGQALKDAKIDVVFPVMHGPLCEDGTIQGLLELADIAYVGCGVLASAVGMDKDTAKRLARDAGIPVVPWVLVRGGTYEGKKSAIHEQIAKTVGFPCFVKPSNMGSSVGVHKVKTAAGLAEALADALRYDSKVLVEKAIDCREVEVAVLEPMDAAADPIASIPGEVIPHHEFYSYEAKYIDENGAGLEIPAKLSKAEIENVRKIAADVFRCLECEGLCRCDFLMDKHTSQFYFNEVNTMPGFTSISMYPKLMEASGMPYGKLLSHLIDLALLRQQRKSQLQRDYAGAIGK